MQIAEIQLPHGLTADERMLFRSLEAGLHMASQAKLPGNNGQIGSPVRPFFASFLVKEREIMEAIAKHGSLIDY